MMDFQIRELPIVRKELKDKEKKNVLKRIHEGNETVNSTLRRLVKEAGIVLPQHTSLPHCNVQIDDSQYLSHIDTWSGLHGTREELANKTTADLRKGANNWANGRRAIILATKVLPDFLDQVCQHITLVSQQLFPINLQQAKDFELLAIPAVYFDLLDAVVKLNNRATATPLFCENAIIKYGLDEKLKAQLTVDVVDIAMRMAENTASSAISTVSSSESSTHSSVKAGVKPRRRKRRGNDYDQYYRDAFKQAFEDLYQLRLREYLRTYGAEDATTATVTSSPVLQGSSPSRMQGQLTENGLTGAQTIAMQDLTYTPNQNPLDQLGLAMTNVEMQLPLIELATLQHIHAMMSTFVSKVDFQMKITKNQMAAIGVVGVTFANTQANAAAAAAAAAAQQSSAYYSNLPPMIPHHPNTLSGGFDYNNPPPPLDRPAHSVASTATGNNSDANSHLTANHTIATQHNTTSTAVNNVPSANIGFPSRVTMPSMSGLNSIHDPNSRKRGYSGDTYDHNNTSAPKRVKTDDFLVDVNNVNGVNHNDVNTPFFDAPDSVYPPFFSQRTGNDSIFPLSNNNFHY